MRVGLRMCGAGREREAGEESVSSGSARVGDEEPCPSGHWSAGSVAGGEDEDVEKEDNSGRAEERKAFSEEMSLVVSTASSPKLVSSGGKASSTGGGGGAGTLSLVGLELRHHFGLRILRRWKNSRSLQEMCHTEAQSCERKLKQNPRSQKFGEQSHLRALVNGSVNARCGLQNVAVGDSC